LHHEDGFGVKVFGFWLRGEQGNIRITGAGKYLSQRRQGAKSFFESVIIIRDYAAASAAAGPKWFFRPLYPMKIPKDFFF
jgi:hypothetical protein